MSARASTNHFAALQQERTIEAAVPAQMLSLAKGLPAAGATSVYQVPDELLELARRERGEPARAPEITTVAPGSLAAAPQRDLSQHWLLAAVIAYLALYASAQLMLGR